MGEGLPSNWSPEPGRRTLSEMETEILSYCMIPESDRARAKADETLRSAIRKFHARRWAWALTSEDLTLVASTADYDLPATFDTSRSCEVLDVNGFPISLLEWRDPKSFTLEFPERKTDGSPSVYTAFNIHETGRVSLDVPASSIFIASSPTLRVRFYKRIAFPISSSEVLDAPTEVEECALWLAKAHFAATYNPGKIGYADGQHRELWQLLIRKQYTQTDWS